jgi:hypothetical protein
MIALLTAVRYEGYTICMAIHPLAGHPAPESVLVDVSKLIAAYFSEKPDAWSVSSESPSARRDTAVHPSSEALTNGISWPSPRRSVSIEQARAQSGRSILVGIPMHARNQRM